MENLTFRARSQILKQQDGKDREKYVVKFIKIMKYLRKINNFNSYLALLSALDSAPIRRLEWQKNITEGLKEYCALIDSSSSFRAYRQALSETNPPCIPYMYVKHPCFNHNLIYVIFSEAWFSKTLLSCILEIPTISLKHPPNSSTFQKGGSNTT